MYKIITQQKPNELERNTKTMSGFGCFLSKIRDMRVKNCPSLNSSSSAEAGEGSYFPCTDQLKDKYSVSIFFVFVLNSEYCIEF